MTEPALTFDDVLIKPRRSSVDSRSEVDLTMNLTPSIELDIPVVAAPMDTVCERELAEEMNDAGGTGFIHRFMSIPDHATQLTKLQSEPRVGVVGVNGDSFKRAERLVSMGASVLCVDVAHAHMDKCVSAVEELSASYDVDIIVGNIATSTAAWDLADAGADTLKVGVGPGACCTTREVAGAGMPQLTAIKNVSEVRRPYDFEHVCIIADGGIKKPGDAAKAIFAGADTVMLGSWFAGCPPAPGDNDIRGMASHEAQETNGKSGIVEGGEKRVGWNAPVEKRVEQLADGLRSATSYAGASTLEEAREKSSFVRVTPNTVERNGIH